MRFLGRSLMGLFMLALAVGLLAWAVGVLVGALEERRSRAAHMMPPDERVYSVEVVKAELRDTAPVLETNGELRSLRTLDLRATAAGRVVELAEEFVEGGQVAAGQILVQIDPAEARSELVLARTELSGAAAERESAEQALALARADLELARSQADLRARSLARQRDLQRRGVGTDAAVEAAELADAAARQVVLTRQQALQQAGTRLAQAEIALERARNAVADAERRLADTTIRAPFAGRLDQVSVVAGGIVARNERLARLIDPAALEVAFRVSTSQYARLLDETGRLIPRRAEVVLDVLGVDIVATGVLMRESGTTGEGRTGRELFARLEDASGMRPGDFVMVRLEEPVLRNVVVLPAQALDSHDRALVLGAGNRLEEMPVTLLRRQGNQVIVRAPDLAGRLVVRRRTPLLGAGIRVQPLRSDAGGEAGTEAGDAMNAAAAGGGGAAGAGAGASELIALAPDRRARLVAFVKNSPDMSDEARRRVLGELQRERVPAAVVARIEARMGG